MKSVFRLSILLFMLAFFMACGEDEDLLETAEESKTEQNDYTALLSNQVEGVIIPAMLDYEQKMGRLQAAVNAFTNELSNARLDSLRLAFQAAYRSYQKVAVHNYYATANQNLVRTSNLFPIDTVQLQSFISNRAYNFNTTAQERANGFPAMDYMLYGASNGPAYFTSDSLRLLFLEALVNSMQAKAAALSAQWQGSLKGNFINNGGTGLGSSISVQLNESLIYYEDHVRENKVGIPIGRLGPNDSPIAPDASKIEAFYSARASGNENLTLDLLRSAIEAKESLYLGKGPDGMNRQGYDDLLISKGQAAVDTDIKAQFQAIYTQLNIRNSISGDVQLYNAIQALVTLYKSDLMPLLNVQDADGANDGD